MSKHKVHLSDHFTFRKIFQMSYAPILMMVFSSLYSIVDGFFVSNFAGDGAFTGVNLIFPIIMIVAGIGFMFGTGGAAFVSALLGQNEKEKAQRTFSMTILFASIIGLFVSLIVFLLIPQIVEALARVGNNTSEETIKNAILYGRIMMAGEVFYIVQNTFQSFFSVAEKPHLGFFFTLAAGLSNMFLDFLLIDIFSMGVVGAALASIFGMVIGSIGPLIYFSFDKKSLINLKKPEININHLFKIMSNGMSEFVSNISGSIVSIVFNIQLLRFVGEAGISAYGIIMYVSYVFMAIFIGYSIGMAPAVGYNYGSGNKNELKNIRKKSLFIVGICGIIMLLLSELLAVPFSKLFSHGDTNLQQIATRAMHIYSFSYLFCGFSIYGSSFFTALNNGIISAVISILRTLCFQLICVIILPILLDTDGIWISIIIAEIASFIMTFVFMIIKQKKYGY